MTAWRPHFIALILCLLASRAAADDADARWQLAERGYVTHAAISDDGRHVVVAMYRPAMDRGGFWWGAWVTLHDLEFDTTVGLADGVGPLALSPDQSRVAFARYVRERLDNRPNCVGITIVRLEDGEKTELTFPESFQPVHRSSRTVLGISWSEEGDELYAIDGWGNLWGWTLSDSGAEPRPEAVILDSLHLSYQIGWGWRGLDAGVKLFIDEEGALQFRVPHDHNEIIAVTWQRHPETGALQRTSELITEVEYAPPADDIDRPVEFASSNSQFILLDNLEELTLTDTATGETTSLSIGPEIFRVDEE